jgi:hypothetical protein
MLIKNRSEGRKARDGNWGERRGERGREGEERVMGVRERESGREGGERGEEWALLGYHKSASRPQLPSSDGNNK